jgi:alanine racemase
MIRSRHVSVRVDLARVRRNADEIIVRTSVPVIAVVKADAYGLGGREVARAIAPVVEAFYVFDVEEAIAYDLPATGRRTIALHARSHDPAKLRELKIQPVVWDAALAAKMREALPILSIDTGQQRFGLPVTDTATIDATIKAGNIVEAFTHATSPAQSAMLVAALRGRVAKLHAAGTALLDDPGSRLDAVRPGLALYRGAVQVTAPLVEVRDATGPAGYTGFQVARHGIFLAGYSNGLRKGLCRINGRTTRILEVGMQSAFIECAPGDRVGDEVTLLGDGLTEQDVAQAWGTSPQEALFRLCGMGERVYSQ